MDNIDDDIIDLSDEIDEENIRTRALASSIVAKRTHQKTQELYACKIGILKKWLTTHNPTSVVANTIQLPLSVDMLMSFLGFVIKDPNTGAPRAVSTITGYTSALSNLYKSHNHTLPAKEIQQFVAGYKRHFAGLKMSGEMKATEGSRYSYSMWFVQKRR
jgi:hypothetical protein